MDRLFSFCASKADAHRRSSEWRQCIGVSYFDSYSYRSARRKGDPKQAAANAKLKLGSWMKFPESPYISQEDGALRIAGTRVGLSSVVAGFREGESPEKIAQEFPTVTLAQAYGAIAYYLENKKLVDDFIAEVDRKFFSKVR